MVEDVLLPMIVIVVLFFCMVCALHQLHSERTPWPTLVWREALECGWSDWFDLENVSSSADYSAVLTAAQEAAHSDAIAVQFASVVRPRGAPEYTLRVLFMSDVRETALDDTYPRNH